MPVEGASDLTFLQGVVLSFSTQAGSWILAILVSIFGLFSKRIVGSVQFALDRAKLRTKQHEELAMEISQFIFSAELATEFIQSESTTKNTLTKLITDYNTYISTVRKKEFLYISWVNRYWGRAQTFKCQNFMKSVRKFDNAVHSINDELGKIEKGESEVIDRKRAKEAGLLMNPAVEKLRQDGFSFLTALD